MSTFRARNLSFRLSAWITLQALVAVQSFPNFAWAYPKEIYKGENLRAQGSEGASAAGLEDALGGRPSAGFASRVDRVTPNGVQIAKRAAGKKVGETIWNAAANTLGPAQNVVPGNSEQVERVAGWAAEGLKWLLEHPVLPVIQRVWDRLKDRKIPVQFLANHAMTMDFYDEDPAIRLDTTIAAELDKPEYAAGRRLLYAVGMFHEAALAAGFTPREAVHLTLGLYQRMKSAEQKALQEILRSPTIDHGNTWALFFEDASLAEFAGIDTLTLEEQLETEANLAVRGKIKEVRNHRERWVSWLMGQLQIDLPYDRIEFRKAMEISKHNVEAGRQAAFDVIRRFDREVEQANAERMSKMVREGWLPEDLPYPTLLAGRASRAFDNQAMLFANAGYLLKTREVVEAGRALHQAAQAKELRYRLRHLVDKAPPAVKEELGKAVQKVEELLAHLGPAADRVRQLVFSPEKVIPSTQISGALQQLEESLENFMTEASRALESAKKQVVSESAERVSRRPASAEATRSLTEPFQSAQSALSGWAGKLGAVANYADAFKAEVLQAESYAAAYSVLLQRPSSTGSSNFRANELEEKPEQEEALRKLTRLGGQNLYMSPTYDWVAEATDIIEAAPLFIYERTITVDGHTLTVFEVDQEGLEQTIRQMADYWAKNIDKTMDSEHVALARELVVRAYAPLQAAASALIKQGFSEEAATRQVFLQIANPAQQKEMLNQVALTAAWLAADFDRRIEQVEKHTEQSWKKNRFIDRVQAMREVLVGNTGSSGGFIDACATCVQKALLAKEKLQTEADRLSEIALDRRRPLPAFHLLTTEAPGLVEGFIQAVLDEEMALRNVTRAKKLEEKVRQRMEIYARRIQELGWKVIREFGYEPIVEKHEALGFSREKAIRQVIGDHLPIQQELAKLAVLAEMEEVEPGTEAKVEQILQDKVARVPLKKKAWALVREHNKNEADFSEQSDLYRQEMEDTVRWLARQQVLETMNKAHPELHLLDRVKRWVRDHSALSLSQTTARRETIAAENLNGLMMDPRYAYSSGVVAETKEGNLRPTGTRKRYHLIYAPSRVNLGKGERKSVEVWPQWVGVTDPLAAAHAKRFYELINFNPQIRMIKEAENLKVSENQWTAMVRAIRNVQAYFVDRLGFGDIEDLAWQFDQREGLPGAALKQGESYQAGPTAGYCIPKDLLFKLFVATLQDDKKLSLIGIPKHLHAGVSGMMVELAVKQRDFGGSVVDWEDWAARELLSEQALNTRFGAKGAKEVGQYLAPYIKVTGGVPVFQVTKILQLLALAGVPSALLARPQALHASLWSNWAERKLTLPAEEVNRSLVFSFAREIVEAAKEAQRLNPSADIVAETLLRVHFYGTYKGDENYPSPPDVRFAWVMRAFMILAGFGKEVALSLDEEGQILARLSWDGFRPDSKDPEDAAVTQYLAKQFGTDPAVVERLKAAFPQHTTVGDITITVVPGVSADDLLGFSSETKNLLGDVAAQVQALLQAKGVSQGQMQANAVLHRGFPFDWVPLTDLSAGEQQVLQKAVGGNIDPLVLKLRGPGTDFLTDLQGQDVAVFSVTHPGIMELNPAHLRDRMLVGRPHSALTALDYVAQGRHRVWFDREVMLWYAAGRGVDEKGEPITDWDQRDSKGRKAVYRAFGFGREEYRPLLGTDLRGEVARQELRAREIYRALEQVANASDADLSRAVQSLRARYEEWFVPEQLSTEAGLAIQYEQQMLLNRRWKPRDAVIREALVDMATGLPAEKFGEVHWLAAGGMFLLNGAPMERRGQVLATIRKAQQKMQPSEAVTAAGVEEDPRVALLIQPGLTVDTIRQAERQGESFSVKASEAIAEKAVQRRKGLALEAARLAGLKARQEGFKLVQPVATLQQIPQEVEAAREQLGQAVAGGTAVQRHAGAVMGITVQVLRRLALEFIPEAEGERKRVLDQIEKLTQGRELDAAAWKTFGGSYEDHGILARLFEMAGPTRREEVLAAMELLTMTLALDKTSDFLALAPEDVDERLLLRALASFYAETIDDHFYEYNPWALDPKRGRAFQEFYGDLGILKPERAEELYRMSWEHHRALYRYVQQLVFSRTGARLLSKAERQDLFGEVALGAEPGQDALQVQAIGAGAPGHYERLWRSYNQFREIAFLRNDGFAMPVVFGEMDPNNPNILDARHRVNFAFLSMVGRTHYSRALMEAGKLGENLFITRDGKMATPAGAKGEVLQISDAQFWLTESQYWQALVTYKGMTPDAAILQVRADRKSGRLTPKGIRVAARFTQPVTIGSVVPLHHHYLADRIWAAGYPGTDKSPGVYEFSYSKVEYPWAYNPAEKTGVYLPPEADWYRADSEKLGEAGAKEAIIKMLRPFVEEHGIIVVKGAEESGARNFKRFDFIDPQARLLQGKPMEDQLAQAADFIYQVSSGQDVAIQRAIIVTPISWMSPEGVKAFVDRQIRDHSVAVNLSRHPKSWVYGTLRGIFSAGVPKNLDDLFNTENWQASHWIALASLQVATNVGRQGTLEMLTPDLVQSQFSKIFIRDFEEAGRKAMAATARAGKKYWDEVYVPAYTKKHSVAPREFDAAGTPYWWPRYLMLDFLPEPVWGRDGKEVPGARVIDVIPGDPKKGTEARFILRDREGNVFEGQVLRFIFWLLEPNVGIGLWPNYWKREEVREKAAAKKEGRDMNWSNIGVSDRIVLSNYLVAGEAFLKATFGPDYFGPDGPPHGDQPDEPPPAPEVPVDQRPADDRTDDQHRMSPPVEVLPKPPSPADLKNLLSHSSTFAVVTGKTTLMNHHLYPWVVSAQGQAVNVVGVYEEWLTADGKAKRIMVLDSKTNRLLEFDLKEPVRINHAFIVELPLSVEVQKHKELTARLLTAGVDVVNPGGSDGQKRADDKMWLRDAGKVPVPQTALVPQNMPEKHRDGILSLFSSRSPNGVVIQPRANTTEGQGVQWFATEDRDAQRAYLDGLLKLGDAMVSTYRGNIGYRDPADPDAGTRPVALRFNVAAGEVTSASAVVAPAGRKIASLGRKGTNEPLAEVLRNLKGPDGSVAVTSEDWARLQEIARQAALAVGLPLVGMDLVLEVDAKGKIGGVVLEANARPGLLIFGERISFYPDDAGNPISSQAAAPAGPAFWKLLGVEAAGVEQILAEENRRVARQMGIELYPQWRGVGADGLPSAHELALLTLQWSPPQAVDFQAAARLLSEKLPAVSAHPDASISFTQDYLTVSLPRKSWAMRDELVRELPGKKIALVVGDSPTGDFLSREELAKQPFPILFVQVLAQGGETPLPDGYPHVVRFEKGPKGVDTLLEWLLKAVQEGGSYEHVFGMDAGGLPVEIRSRPVNPEELVIFTDVDGTSMGSASTFDESQAGIGGQSLLKEQKNRVVELAKRGTDFRFITGKTGQEVSSRRVRNDEDRLVKPLGAALIQAGVSPQKVGFDGVSGMQRGRFTPEGRLNWTRAELPGGKEVFSEQEAVRVFGLLLESVAKSAVRKTAPEAAGVEEEQRAVTLREWQQILADPVGSGFWETLKNRYGEEETDLHQALAAYQQLVMGALANGFDPSQKIVIVVASPGRDRVFMGHTDSPGLGGFTINVATEEEVLAALQVADDGLVHLKNSDPAYLETVFPMDEIRQEAQKHTDRAELLSKPKKIWDAARWESYLKAALTFMVAQMPGVDQKIGSSGMRLYVSSVGPRALPATGGVSSSSALTGTISVAMNALFKLGLSLEQLAEVDYGEYLLDKSAGAGDKAAQLFAKRGEVGVVNSFPDSFREAVKFPKGLTVLMAESPIPRLSTSDGLEWLRKNSPQRAAEIHGWAKETLARFGSRAYVRAVRDLKEVLTDLKRLSDVGLTETEGLGVLRALEDGLLRELSAGGRIERELPDVAGWENRDRRYRLIYRLLSLLPEREIVVRTTEEGKGPNGGQEMKEWGLDLQEGVRHGLPDLSGKGRVPSREELLKAIRWPKPKERVEEVLVLDVRKAALYGLAELERGTAYLQELRAATDAQDHGDLTEAETHLRRVLALVRWAQDGDRATVDHRKNGFTPTPWASDFQNDVSEPTIIGWRSASFELFSRPGGFERSIVELDEMADRAHERFKGKVAMRVAAAGMGGTMAVHATDDVVADFKAWIEAKGWKVRKVRAGAPTQVIVPPMVKVPGQLHLDGKDVVVKGDSPVTLLELLQLPNGSWLVPEGGSITLHPGVRIGPFVVISAGFGSQVRLGPKVVVKEGTTVEGNVSVVADSQLWGVVRGHPNAPTILGSHTKILDPGVFIDHGVITVPVKDEKGKTYGVSIYDARIGEEAGRGPVVIWGGTDLRKGVTVRPNSILGPFAHLGPGSEAKATVWMGASAEKNDSAFAHRGYGGNLVAIPVYLDGTPLDDAWHAQLLERLAALRFGRVVSREAEKTTEAGPESRPRLNLVMDLDGKKILVSVRGINFGDEAGASNFKAISGGRKAIGVISPGTVLGVGAKVQTPVFVGPDSLIDNGAQANGLQAAEPKTYVRPIGTASGSAFRPGKVKDLQGKSDAQGVRLFLANLRTLQTWARVSLIGLKRNIGPRDALMRAALRAEVRALKGHFDEIDAYTAKELELLGKTPDANQVPALAKQAQQLRAGWADILVAIEKRKDASAAGAEELPADANPLSDQFAPWKYEAASPMGASEKQVVVLDNPALASELRHQGYRVSEIPVDDTDALVLGPTSTPAQAGAAGLYPVYSLDTFDPQEVAAQIKVGKRVILRTKQDRVGQDLWQMEDNREELQYLYGLVYDIADGATSLTPIQVGWVVKLLNHSNQAVAAAARDVIVEARVHHLRDTVRAIAERVRDRKERGPYSEYYFRDAMTAFIDPVHKMELGSPATPVFAGEMNEDRMHQLHEQLIRWVDPKSRLSLFSGSGQRTATPIALVEAGFQNNGFPPQKKMVDIGSQPHDVVKVMFALVAKLFAENMPQWRKELGKSDGDKEMPEHWSVAIGMDPRSTGPAIFQVAARIFRKMGVGVKFIGITSAPEAAARALLSDPKEDLLASYEITPSHIAQGFQGTKLMLWTGQILPWSKAEEFNEKIRKTAGDYEQVKQVIEMLQDPALNAEIEEIMRRMPQDYADSKARYHRYLMQMFTGSSKTGLDLEQEVERLAKELERLRVTVVLDANGGARIPDLPVYDRIFRGYVVIGANAAEFAHPLPPGEISARSLMEFGRRIAPAFDQDKICCLWVGPDPDGDRKGIVYRAPDGEFHYLDPQAGYLLDVLNHVLSAQEAGVPGIGIVANEATTVVAKMLAERLGIELLITETGEANVVAGINRLISVLSAKHGAGRSRVAVLGGEGSAAATIGGDVQVRDMIQGVISMSEFLQKPDRVRKLIQLLVDDPQEKERLLGEVDSWYLPGRLQYLFYHIVHEVFPAMRNTDPGYDTEVQQGVGLINQQPFKDTADRLLRQDGEWIERIRQETADVLGVPAEQIRVSDPVNSVEDYQLPGAGKRTLADGRTIHDGGYEIQVFYRDPASGKEHYLYKLELRRSKTQVGDTRRMVFNVITFLPREKAEVLAGRLYDRTRSLWLAFLNDVEAEELMGHVQGTFDLPPLATLEDLSSSLGRLLSVTRDNRAEYVDTLADSNKKTYSKVDTENINEQDAAAAGAMDALKSLLNPVPAVIPPLPAGTSRNEIAYKMAWALTHRVFEWKRQRFAGNGAQFSQVLQDLSDFSAKGTAAQQQEGVAYANLIVDKIILSKEVDFLQTAAGAEETIPLRAEAESLLVILTPETALAGLEELTVLRGASGEGVRLAVIAGTHRQMAQVAVALETTAFRLEVPVISLEGTGWNLEQAISGVQVQALQRNLDPVVVRTNRDLLGLGRLLVPGKSMRSWLEWLDRLQLGVEA